MFGQESSTYQEKIDMAQEEALNRAMKEAIKKGGNAIVSAKMDLESFQMICFAFL